MSTAQTTAVDVMDVDAIRARFPALARRHAGHPVAYFDGPGGTQVPQSVVDAMARHCVGALVATPAPIDAPIRGPGHEKGVDGP